MKKVLSLALVFLLAASLLIGCTPAPATGGETSEQPPAEAPTGDVIRIGIFEPVTGENGGGGFQEVLGARFGHQLVNTVDIGGKTYTIELVELDNKSDKTEAVTVAANFVAQKVSAVIGSYGSGVSIAAGPTFEENQIPAVAPSATNPQVTLGNDYYFRVCFLDPFQGEVMANYAYQDGMTKAAVITQLGDDYSSGLGNFFLKAFKELGGEIVSEQQFQTNETDFKAILANVKNANPDVIFAPSSIATAPLLIKQARELGITAKIMAGDTWENQSIIDNAGADAEGVAISTFFDENDTSSPKAGEFVKGFKEFLNATPDYVSKNGGDGVAAVSALGFDAYNVVVEAIKAAQSTEGSAIRDALAGLSVEGVTGAISFDENGDAKKDMAYIKVIKDGAFTFDKTVKTK